jgi:hypothetical protein
VGTVLPNFKPYSQLGPSVLCLWLIVFFIQRQAVAYRKRSWVSSHSSQTAVPVIVEQ